ncbi:hypothetical protein BC938DRAFT_477332 [Jimgerdemannia flammicorona]|uniref:USP domain-containing protein n=1 Tax=Jimgerdemannia flammicorona TaxID=994334 RepID=A0A433QPF5_9FUNG|nr:hypothetical protein BC938DRAFT_477332 [Jimgerdemannia flammicorona]
MMACLDPTIPMDLELLLYRFFQDEHILYKCESCENEKATVRHTIRKLPRILVLHLKRFAVNMDNNVCEKRRDSVIMNQHLNLGQWCSLNTEMPPKWAIPLLSHLNSNELKLLADECKRSAMDEVENAASLSEINSSDTVDQEIGRFLMSSFKDPSVLSEEAQLTWVLRESMKEAETPASPPPFTIAKSQEEIDMEKAIELSLQAERENKENINTLVTNPARKQLNSLVDEMKRHKKLSLIDEHLAGYLLQCVVSHKGSSLFKGHYICDVRDGDGIWKCYNDTVMSSVGSWEKLDSLRRCMGYLMFFVHEQNTTR